MKEPTRRSERSWSAVGTALGAMALASSAVAQLPGEARRESIAPLVTIAREDGRHRIAGSRTTVSLDETNLGVDVEAGGTRWSFPGSSTPELIVRVGRERLALRLGDAVSRVVSPYRTGFRTGVKIDLSGWPRPGAPETDPPLDLALHLTLGIESREEDLVFEIVAEERDTRVRQLDWPPALDASAAEYTVLPAVRGQLLPRDWPEEFDPIRPPRAQGAPPDTSEIQSHVIESWSMSFWGFKKGRSAMMVLVETPDDAAYRFRHPAGGPTVIGPRWRATLGRLGYPRAVRFCFFDTGDYVTLAKRYRRHAMETGTFVSLAEKITRTPLVRSLVGTPLTRLSILRNLKEDSQRYDRADPSKNYSRATFDERAEQLRALKARGIDRLHVCLTGWPSLGYDRQHPDELPPAAAAGGAAGMKRLADTCRDLGYLLTLHDQYRDYYLDAPSYDPQLAIHEEDDVQPAQAFPGTRFGSFKRGRIPFMTHWDGGTQSYLSPRYMLGHLRQNYDWLLAHGIRPDGVYLDVFGYVPPDEDWNDQHPATRSDALRERAACFTWVRERLGLVGTEAACDWTIPYAHISSPLRPGRAVPVPLFDLVYHDAILTPYGPTDLRGFLNGGLPQVSLADLEGNLDRVREIAALHERVALLEMTGHEFLDPRFRKERTTFADGTAVTVDWDANTVKVTP
jgi:hypothetical protein